MIIHILWYWRLVHFEGSRQNGVSILYIMLETHHSGLEPSNFNLSVEKFMYANDRISSGSQSRNKSTLPMEMYQSSQVFMQSVTYSRHRYIHKENAILGKHIWSYR